MKRRALFAIMLSLLPTSLLATLEVDGWELNPAWETAEYEVFKVEQVYHQSGGVQIILDWVTSKPIKTRYNQGIRTISLGFRAPKGSHRVGDRLDSFSRKIPQYIKP